MSWWGLWMLPTRASATLHYPEVSILCCDLEVELNITWSFRQISLSMLYRGYNISRHGFLAQAGSAKLTDGEKKRKGCYTHHSTGPDSKW
jgi:hypothetical protein